MTQSRLARPRQCALIQRVERRGWGWGDWGGAPLVLPVLRTEMTRLSVVRRKLIRREVLNVGRTRGPGHGHRCRPALKWTSSRDSGILVLLIALE